MSECVALLEIKSRPKFDEGIFESYVHLNIVVLALIFIVTSSSNSIISGDFETLSAQEQETQRDDWKTELGTVYIFEQ